MFSEETILQQIEDVGQGNPGAIVVIRQILDQGHRIDPLDWALGLSSVFMLKERGIKGSDVWVLYKDICQEKVGRVIGLMRALQLGLLSSDLLKEEINQVRQKSSRLDVEGLVERVKETLGGRFHPEG